jgi:hypothetical protein
LRRCVEPRREFAKILVDRGLVLETEGDRRGILSPLPCRRCAHIALKSLKERKFLEGTVFALPGALVNEPERKRSPSSV